MPLPLEDEPKTPLTAVVLIPPEGVWEAIQAIRRVHDPQFIRWMPHVTLLYPFVPAARLEEAAERLRPAAAGVQPFELSLGGFGHFSHGGRSATLWLRPEPVEALRELHAQLQAAVPWCSDVAGFPGGFQPHLSLGRFRDAAEAERLGARLAAAWQPIVFRVEQVAIIARSGAPAEPFCVECLLPLGGPPAGSA